MDNTLSWVQVARVKDAHGIRGELYIRFRSPHSDWITGRKELRLVEDNGAIHHFKIEKLRIHKEGAILQLEGLKTRNEAEALKGCFWEVQAEDFVSRPGEKIYLQEVAGFSVFDEGQNFVGEIYGFSFNGAQDLLQVRGERGEHEIPFINEFILKIDNKSREIYMKLPEGLLEL